MNNFTQKTSDKDSLYNVFIKGAAVNTVIIALNIVLFAISMTDGGTLINNGALSVKSVVADREYYRIILAAFLHADLIHIFNNMLILAGIGAAAERAVGHIGYFILYFISIIGGNLFSLSIDISRNNVESYSIGASGAVFGIMGAVLLITIAGRSKLKKGSTFLKRLIFIVVYSVISGIGNDGINIFAHIGGLCCGIVFACIFSIIKRNRINMEELI